MPLVCRYKPRRSKQRVFTPKDAARVMCATIGNGATQEEIEAEAAARECWTLPSDRDCERKRRAAVAVAEQLIEENNTTLAVAESVLRALGLLFGATRFVLQRTGLGAVASVPVAVLVTNVNSAISRIQVQRAANDALFRAVAGLR